MSFINWGHESPEQKALRRRFEEEQAIFEQRAAAVSAAAAAASGSGKIIDNSWIGKAKSSLRSRYEEVTALVPNIYLFWDDHTNGGDPYGPMPGINDGGDDMYDGGNYMNTNLTANWDDIKNGDIDNDSILAAASIPYTHTQADNEDDSNEYVNPPMNGKIKNGTDYFGPNSRYFTNMYPGLFIMVADNIAISEFNISGNVGSDGEGVGAGYIDNIGGWTLFWKTNTDNNSNDDPSINQLILVPGNSTGITQEYDTSSEYDDHRLTGLSDRGRLIYAVVARQPDQDVLSEEDAILVAQKLLEIIVQPEA